MTHAERLAGFVARAAYEDLSDAAVRELKIRVLDSLGCAVGALGGEPVRLVREQIEEFGGNPLVTLIGGGKTAPDRAAFYNGALTTPRSTPSPPRKEYWSLGRSTASGPTRSRG